MPEKPFDTELPSATVTPAAPLTAEPPAAKVVINAHPGAEPTRIGAQVFISGRPAAITTDPELDQP